MAFLLRHGLSVEANSTSHSRSSLSEFIVISQRRYVHSRADVRLAGSAGGDVMSANHGIAGTAKIHRSRELRRDASTDVWGERVRDVIGIGVAALALVVLSPLMIFVAVLIKIDSPGPVLFRQERIGRNRRRNPLTPRDEP